MKTITVNFFIIPLLYIFLYIISNYIICYFLPLQITPFSEVLTLTKKGESFFSILNESAFWNSSIGLFMRLLIEIMVSGVILFLGFIIYKIPVRIKTCFLIIALAHSIFLVNIWAEFIFLKIEPNGLSNDYFTMFPLFSLSYLLETLNIPSSEYFSYFHQTIGLFEILYWFLLAFIISRFIGTSYKTGLKVVFSSYVPLLFIWLLIVSFLSIMKS